MGFFLISQKLSVKKLLTKRLLGQQSERDLGSEKTITAPQHHHLARGSLVSPTDRVLTVDLCLYSDEPTGRLALVFELMDMNMYEAIKGRRHYLPE